MEILGQKYRRNPNQRVQSAYFGVASGMRTVTRVTALNKDADRLETTRAFGAGIPRGQGGQVAHIILGGLETTLDEIEYMLEGIKEKKFVPQRKNGEIALMCQQIAERRNAEIKRLRKNPSEMKDLPIAKPRRGLYLPKGFRMMQTPIPGFQITVRG